MPQRGGAFGWPDPGEWRLLPLSQVRPAARAGVEYDGGDISETVGFSLTLGRRYGARITVQRGLATGGGPAIVLMQLGGYFSF